MQFTHTEGMLLMPNTMPKDTAEKRKPSNQNKHVVLKQSDNRHIPNIFDFSDLIENQFLLENVFYFENDDLPIVKANDRVEDEIPFMLPMPLKFTEEEKQIEAGLNEKIKQYAIMLGYDVELLTEEQIAKIIIIIRESIEKLLNESFLEAKCPSLKYWTSNKADKAKMEKQGHIKRIKTVGKGGEKGLAVRPPLSF